MFIFSKWLDEDMPTSINPIALRAQMKHLAEDTIEVYSNKIENETARKLLKLIFEAGDNEFEDLESEDDGNAEEEED